MKKKKPNRKKATVEEVEDEGEPEAPQVITQPLPPQVVRPPAEELPYRNVPPVRFAARPTDPRRSAGGNTQNTAEPPAAVRKERNYRLRAPIEDSDSEDEVDYVTQIVKAIEVGLPLEKLLKLSPKLRQKAKEALTKVRIPIKGVLELAELLEKYEVLEADEALPSEDFTSSPMSSYVQADAISTRELPYSPDWTVTDRTEGLVPKGSFVVGDPVLQYLARVPFGEAPKQIFVAFKDIYQVAGDSEALRVLFPLINGIGEQESICDGGSQIVSMSQAIAIELGLGWDPSICIYMQSANGQVEKSVGLSKNVPFLFGEVTLYLQVHVIRKPAYKVLLGRPFDVLAGSNVQNGTDGSQLITLTDPNTQKKWVIPTFPRGVVRQLKKVRDASAEIEEPPAEVKFQNSMNW